MDTLPFPLLAGEALHAVRGSVARLLAVYPRRATQAELLVAALRAGGGRTVFFHEGNGAFEVYDPAAGQVVAVEVKFRQTKVASDPPAWGRKLL